MSVQPFCDPDTGSLIYHVVPTYQTESVSEIVTETESAISTTTIESGDVSEYFVTHHGRLQPASENVFRWLPLDNTRRDILRHVVEKYLFGDNYIGPVREILSSDPGPGRQHRVLEIGTRGGSWAQEMAAEFPRVRFTSVDVAPLVPHVPRSNISFEVYDISQGLLAEDTSQDIVFVNGGREMVMNYQALLLEVHRILRPGGLIHIREYGPGLWDSKDSSKPARETNPKGCEAFDLVLAAVASMGADPDVCAKIPQWLSPDSELWKGSKHPRGFEQIYPTVKLIPPHPHDGYPCSSNIDPRMVPLIRHYNLACVRDGVGLLCDSGLTMENAESLIEAMAEEYKYPEKCPLLKWHTVYATKRSGAL